MLAAEMVLCRTAVCRLPGEAVQLQLVKVVQTKAHSGSESHDGHLTGHRRSCCGQIFLVCPTRTPDSDNIMCTVFVQVLYSCAVHEHQHPPSDLIRAPLSGPAFLRPWPSPLHPAVQANGRPKTSLFMAGAMAGTTREEALHSLMVDPKPQGIRNVTRKKTLSGSGTQRTSMPVRSLTQKSRKNKMTAMRM